MSDDMVNEILRRGILSKPQPPRDSWGYGVVSSATLTTADVVLDGDTEATTMPVLAPCHAGAHVLVLLLGGSRIVVGVVGGACPKAVGDVLITENETHPEDRWPGTEWEAYGPGRVIVGHDPAATDLFDEVGLEGGSRNAVVVQHAHSYGHVSGDYYGASPDVGSEAVLNPDRYGYNDVTANAGVSGTNKNLQPYVVAYVWKRMA